MTYEVVNLSDWNRADQFRFFRTYERPHYAVTSRLDVTNLMEVRKPQGTSPYRACLHAIGAGIHGVPELLMRFRDDVVVRHETAELSVTVPTPSGNFNYAYLPWSVDFAEFDTRTRDLIEETGKRSGLDANAGERDDVVYLSCMPWLDYTSINNALPGKDDCIPRVSWGKFVRDHNNAWRVAMTIEVHHALVDGAHVGNYFTGVQDALNDT